MTTYVVLVSSGSPIGPRACSFCVEMPISAPKPNSPPSVKRVEALTMTAALDHIERWGSGHSEAIVADSARAIADFTAGVDAAAVLVNASTRFTDGGEFGFGAEIGISTQKLHARGPLGLPELTSTTYVVTGNGHTRC